MYTLIEEIESQPLPQSQQAKSHVPKDAFKMSLQGRRPDIQSSYPSEEPQFYEEPKKNVSSVKSVMNNEPRYSSETPVSDSSPTPDPNSNAVIVDYIKRLANYTKDSVNYFAEKERSNALKLQFIEQLLKGIGIVLLILVIFLMIKK